MTDRRKGSDNSFRNERLEARLARVFETELRRAEGDLTADAVQWAPAPERRRASKWNRGILAAAWTLGLVGVVLMLGVATTAWFRGTTLSTVGLAGATPPSGSMLSAARATDIVSSQPAPAMDRYTDGVPRTLGGEHVYRPADLARELPAGAFLLGGWDAGPLPVSCPIFNPKASNPPCAAFEGLAEERGGQPVIALRWGAISLSGPIVVLRVTAQPGPSCRSVPGGACPGPEIHLLEVLWSGTP